MRLQEFARTFTDTPEEKWRDIQTQCSDICKIYKRTRKLLYRGLQDYQSADYFEGSSPYDRQPLDSSPRASALLNRSLKLLNISALRSKSVFTTPVISDAFYYTHKQSKQIYAIFPKNGFQYAWSRRFNDITVTDNTIKRILGIIDDMPLPAPSELDISGALKIQNEFHIVDTDIEQAMVLDHEVWFTGEYIAVRAIDNENFLRWFTGD